MFIDAREIDEGFVHQADVCVVGSGAAGLPLACRLASAGLSVILIESGGLGRHPDYSALNDGTSNLAEYPFQAARARTFGGTTTRWTGACIALDDEDFRKRDWLPLSGWPIGPDALAPYLPEAGAVFGLTDSSALRDRIDATPFGKGDLTAKVVQYAEKADLGRDLHDRVATSENLNCWLHATATRIIAGDDARVSGVEVQTITGRRITAFARATVLACGGIENARLMLASAISNRSVLGDGAAFVGRCHMEHPIRSLAVLPIGEQRKAARAFTDILRPGPGEALANATFGLSPEVRRKEHLLDLHLRLARYHPIEGTPAIVQAKAAWRKFAGHGWPAPASTPPKGLDLLRASYAIPRYLAWHFANKAVLGAPFDHVRLTAFVEQEPDPANRVTLSRRTDRFGQPLADVHLRESPLLENSIQRSLERLSVALAANGLPGLVRGATETAHLQHYQQFGLHQMGETRMSANPSEGVVDGNCKVHCLANLFIAGSSVFSTGGSANPTLTITALSLRLADHIATLDLSRC